MGKKLEEPGHQPYSTTPEHRALVLARLAEIWAAAPSQRLGQLVLNLGSLGMPLSDNWLNHLWCCADLDLVAQELP
jgi:hypothetical protein